MMKGRFQKQVARASGAQIGKRTQRIIACPSCLRGGEKSKTPCECGDQFSTFDSRGEWNQWILLRHAEQQGVIGYLRRQVPMPLKALGGEKVGNLVLDFVYEEDGETVYADYKGGAMTELAAWKLKHFAAQYGQEVLIHGGPRP